MSYPIQSSPLLCIRIFHGGHDREVIKAIIAEMCRLGFACVLVLEGGLPFLKLTAARFD